jgi:dTDP-4-dehydrorhamnose 3,5-epimerase
MKVTRTEIPDVMLIEPKVFGDTRGFFFESFNARAFAEQTGVETEFVQDNHSRSAHGVLRGLHYQIQQPQGKLVRVVAGEVFDVAVDHPPLITHVWQMGRGLVVRTENKAQFWVPAGFAHGFVVLSDAAEFLYKTTEYYAPEHEQCIAWNDPFLNISWPDLGEEPKLSAKDAAGVAWADARFFD